MTRTNVAGSAAIIDSDATSTRLSYPRFRQSFEAVSEPKWPREVLSKLTSLLKLTDGWDSYGARAPSWDAAMFALAVLDSVMQPSTPSPSVVPTSSGGVQLEWHVNKMDLEIHVEGPYAGDYWWRDHVSGKEDFGDIDSADLTALLEPIARVAKKAT
ncbi:MAG: hypothetical protein JOY64_29445 [Alphaproteobacteria bacterium]|nr:hypothetical protein [Alphaproteobacteria bacterium]MBV8411787.1 hypothetical protein [Alphaproteobacteria bacterium]